MRYIFILLLLVSTAYGQFAPTSAKTKFVNGIAIGSRDTSQFTAADTIALTIARDSVMYYRYRGFWRPIATGGNLSAYKLISDTLFNNGYTTRARLKQGLDSLAATKVSSVGLTMPSAFNVANSPITSSGTIAVTAAGNATQYIRGDGALATLPTSGSGGGASVSYYLNGSVNQGTIGGVTYYEMNETPIIGAGTDFTRNSNGYIASFLTDANDPALLVIPAGNWNFETYFQASSGGGTPSFYIELYKYDGTTFTLIASNSGTPKTINDGVNVEAYFSALAVPQTTLTLTDRLAVRIYVTTAGRTITLHTENNTLCQVITTFTTGLTALNGLTAQVQYFATGTSGSDFNISSATATHTFNLPTASATNRGALSSANWTTFNNKIGPSDTAAMLLGYTRVQRFTDSLTNVQSRIQTKQNILTLTTTGTSGAATLTGATLNIPQYQAALTNPVTGTGTTNLLPKFTGASTIDNSNITDNGSSITLGGSNVFVSGNLTTTGRVGIGSSISNIVSVYSNRAITGGTTAVGFYQDGAVQSDVTSSAFGFFSNARTQATTFTLANYFHNYATQTTLGAGSSITNQHGYFVENTLTGASNLNTAFNGNIPSGTGRWNLYMNGTANNYVAGALGIGSVSLTGVNFRVSRAITGSTSSQNVINDGVIQSDVTSQMSYFRTGAATQAASFTLSELNHYRANQISIGAGSSITNQNGFYVDATLTGATNNYAFRGQLGAATGRWNLFMDGAANNYLNGRTLFGTTTDDGSTRMQVSGAIIASLGIRAQRGNFTSLVLNKDSVPISTTNIWGITLDTSTNRINRRNLSNVLVSSITFDTTTRVLSIPTLAGGSSSVVIPRGTASGSSGIVALSSSRTGNLVTVSGDNGSTTTFSIRDADSTTRANLIAGNGLSGSSYNGVTAQTWTADTTVLSTKNNVTALLLGYSPTSSLGSYAFRSTGLAELTGANFTGNVGFGVASPISKIDVLGGGIRTLWESGQTGDNVISGINGISNGFRAVVSSGNAITYTFHNGDNTAVLQLANSGAATYSSSVTASSFIRSGGTSTQYLMADGSVTTANAGSSGTYTPTITGVSNVAASTSNQAQYMRVGNVVTVSGYIEVDPTSGNTPTQFRISLPVSTSWGSGTSKAGGVMAGIDGDAVGTIYADPATDTVTFRYTSSATASNMGITFTFTYLIE